MKRFNVLGPCVPEIDYMVDLSDKIRKVKALIDEEYYFEGTCPRQFRKSTMLYMLERELDHSLIGVSFSFESFSIQSFTAGDSFCSIFLGKVEECLRESPLAMEDETWVQSWKNSEIRDFGALESHISKCTKDHKVILMIDEIDKTSNNQIFIHFLGILRDLYQWRRTKHFDTFHSVILASQT